MTDSVAKLDADIKAQGDAVRGLKASKADKAEIKTAVDALLSLKAQYKAAAGKDWSPSSIAEGSQKKPEPKCKGTKSDGGKPVALAEPSGKGLTSEQEKALKDSAVEALDIKIKNCGDLIRKLKVDKADPDIVKDEVKVLLMLKDLYKQKSGHDWKLDGNSAPPPKQAAVGGAKNQEASSSANEG